MRVVVIVIMLCAVQLLSAQIRIIPQDKLLEVAEPKIVDCSLQFTPRSVDFGTIDEMAVAWQGSAQLQNVGTDTLVVTQIRTTCGCLKAEMSKRVIAPRERLEVNMKYYPRGHAGKVKQRVLIYTNLSSERASAVLTLTGFVTASEDRRDDYPYTRGVLRLRQDTIRLSGAREVQRIAIMNGGSTDLQLSADASFLPKGVSVRFEPAKIAPKGEGDMVVEYNPTTESASANFGKIYIKGLNLPPRQCSIDVVFKR